ncbi:hypothetical protein [Persicobacter diffluens]|uniref:Energy transducer TonB n=1 Tax=Persicobacter diffluens TaxID=981 RepID=A0AAN4VW57_9BACT|nr:hypothetical protein PEDI_13550 [Persicobacter diffluens]
MKDAKQKKREQLSGILTAILTIALVVCFYFISVWQAPDPPLPVYGLELSLGMDESGSGEPVQEIQAQAPTPNNPEPIQPEPLPEVEEVPQEVMEEVPEQTQPVEETVETPVEDIQEEPSWVEEKPEEVVSEPEEPKKEKLPAYEFPSDKKTEDQSNASAASSGDDDHATGTKGKEEGKIDERGIYSGSFGAKGASLDMKGWAWDAAPRPSDNSNESGKIVYQIRIDEDGEIQEVRRLESTVRPEVEARYRRAVEQLTFSRSADNLRPAPFTTGKITFIINAN